MILDVPRTLLQLMQNNGWVRVTNRLGAVTVSEGPIGVRCLADYTSTLHVCDVFPRIGRVLQKRALGAWPVQFAERVDFSSNPQVSFIIAHRGKERSALLDLTIRSIACIGEQVECLVVEQDQTSTLESLPGNTRYLFAPSQTGDTRWNKSYAYNLGAMQARGACLVFQDSDLPVPVNYLEVIREHLLDRDRDVVFPQRFLFHLNAEVTRQIVAAKNIQPALGINPEMIRQNWTGGTLGIKREAFYRIGGFDERFSGWAGEDREFYDRCQLLNGWFHGYVPFFHLWHPRQPESGQPELLSQANSLTAKILAEDRIARIRGLRQRIEGAP